ncbi:aldehyde dehydrogenase family protein [Porphyrobacter sp. YT40]|uniref:aldehyde dehydrogenase family protein n=1 Tax=Porphyrobacter sp. YT40 TaxID=2547601 RepID=UPI001141E535|nr:aldehyde dehydrogenase family protein [Porphyrobacter sp. YT40]
MNLSLAEPKLLRAQAFVDGAWIDGEARIDVLNPADSSLVGSVPDLGYREAEGAVDAAYRALTDWRKATGKQRAAILRRWYDLVLVHTDDLARLLTAEQGKPLHEAKAEVVYAASFIEWFAEEAKRVNGDVLAPHAADHRLLVRREPVGVVGAVTPWNFPLVTCSPDCYHSEVESRTFMIDV